MFDVGIFDDNNDDLMMLDEPPPSFAQKLPKAASESLSINKVSDKPRRRAFNL
jgi:hypothetical protein